MTAGSNPSDRPVAVIVSHTHWDREWYLSFHRFRTNLARVVKLVLRALEDDPDFLHFLLDGQTIILEDYLETHPEDRERIAGHVRSGALAVGPWYILPDEFLVSAESTVRNLLYGQKVGLEFGGVQKVGYMPDSFGHIAQLPQLLRLAGIDSFVYTRGDDDAIDASGLEYLWRAPDGSEVTAVNQPGGYCNAAVLGLAEIWHGHTRRRVDPEIAVQKVAGLLEEMGRRSNSSVYLFNNGCDHLPPQPEFGSVLAALKDAHPGVEFLHGSLSGYLERLRSAGGSFPVRSGELRWGKLHPILTGVWSARMYLKQHNDRAQTMLSCYAEPLAAYTHFVLGGSYPGGELESAWKLLLQNHPHDSICGCSTDDVHRAMIPRFAGVIDTCDQLARNSLENIAHTFATEEAGDRDTVLTVFNPVSRERDVVVRRLVVLQPLDYDIESLRLVDESGSAVPFRVLATRYVERFWGIDYRTELFFGDQLAKLAVYAEQFPDRYCRTGDDRKISDLFLIIEFLASGLPPLGHANYRFTDSSGLDGPAFPGTVRVGGRELENEHCRVVVNANGTFDVEDRASGEWYRGLNRFTDTGDAGDEYDYSPVGSVAVTSDEILGDVAIVDDTGLAGAIEVRFDLVLPASASADRTMRSGGEVRCPVVTRVSLGHDSRVVEVVTEVDNRARDHRLRVEFPASVATDSIVSDGHFYHNVRTIVDCPGDDWVQPPGDTFPQQGFSLVQGGGRGLAVFNRGLPEIAASPGASEGTGLALTLLRCVDWLSRDDFPTRRNQNAGPTVYTPDAQCPGVHRFEYAVMPFSTDHVAAGVAPACESYRLTPLVIQGVEEGLSPGGPGLLGVRGQGISVSAVKKHETRESLVVRLWNETGDTREVTLQPGGQVRRAWWLGLLEDQRLEPVAVDGATVNVALAPHQIATLELSLG